jgi:hypothetical protein
LADIADPVAKAAPGAERNPAQRALAVLHEMSPDLRGGAILDSSGEVVAASGDPGDWGSGAAKLFAAADAAGSEPAEAVHVATEAGEVFALRHAGLVGVTVTERFTLASLALYDLRSALRGLAAEREEPPEG